MRFPTRLLLALALVVTTACGSGSDDSEPGAGASPTTLDQFPVTIEAANGRVTIAEQPTAIVSLSPTATEMLFAINAGDQVIAVDDNSDYPAEVPTTDLSGFEPNVESVASYEPDLVVLSNDPAEVTTKALGKLDIPVLLQPAAATLDDSYTQIEQLGTATGHVEDAAAVVESMKSEIAAIVSTAPTFESPPTYFHELDDVYFTVTSDTFIGQVYSLLGLENIADAAKGGSDYPQLSAEYIVESDPDIIFLADAECCNQSADTVAKRPGWDQITAVKTGAVVELDEDIASRWGPRVVDYLRTVAEALGGVDS